MVLLEICGKMRVLSQETLLLLSNHHLCHTLSRCLILFILSRKNVAWLLKIFQLSPMLLSELGVLLDSNAYVLF